MPNRFSLENPKENDPPATIVYKLANLLPGRSINNSDTLQHRWAKKTVTYVRNVTRPPSHIHRPTYPPTHATTAPKKRAKKNNRDGGGGGFEPTLASDLQSRALFYADPKEGYAYSTRYMLRISYFWQEDWNS